MAKYIRYEFQPREAPEFGFSVCLPVGWEESLQPVLREVQLASTFVSPDRKCFFVVRFFELQREIDPDVFLRNQFLLNGWRIISEKLADSPAGVFGDFRAIGNVGEANRLLRSTVIKDGGRHFQLIFGCPAEDFESVKQLSDNCLGTFRLTNPTNEIYCEELRQWCCLYPRIATFRFPRSWQEPTYVEEEVITCKNVDGELQAGELRIDFSDRSVSAKVRSLKASLREEGFHLPISFKLPTDGSRTEVALKGPVPAEASLHASLVVKPEGTALFTLRGTTYRNSPEWWGINLRGFTIAKESFGFVA